MIANKHCPLFISFEGGEGAGKTTLIHHLQSELAQLGYSVLKTREPGGTSLGEKIRQVLLQQESQVNINSLTEMLLFLAARSQHIEEVIKPALVAGKMVLCDRFNDSTVVYQGIAREIGEERVLKWCRDICQEIMPEITLFLDLDPNTGMERAIKQGRAMDRMEKEQQSFHEKVRQGFLKIAADNPTRVFVIDAHQSSRDVFEQAKNIILNKLHKKEKATSSQVP